MNFISLKKSFLTASFLFVFLSLFVFPVTALAQQPGDCREGGVGVVPCGCDTHDEDGNPGPDGIVTGDEQCDFEDLILLINNIIEWIIIFAISVSALLFAYAGFLYITAGGKESQISRAHNIFKNAAIGFIISVAAYLIVWTITTALVGEDSDILQFLFIKPLVNLLT